MKLKLLYALHMLAPISLTLWHVGTLSRETLLALQQMGGG